MKKEKAMFVLAKDTDKKEFEGAALKRYPHLGQYKRIHGNDEDVQVNNQRYRPIRIFVQKSAGLNIRNIERLTRSLNVFEIDI